MPRKLVHGHSMVGKRSRTHISWKEMRARCLGPNPGKTKHYRARGITICERWNSFVNFLADMGERPPNMTLDRIDTNGNYEPGNCRWASRKVQSNNTRAVHLLTIDGTTLNITQWANIMGIRRNAIYARLSLGWNERQAVFSPVETKYVPNAYRKAV